MAEANREEKRFKIGEVCRIADVAPYVLRYWETEFPVLAPNKSGGGQRLYSQREVDLILRIKHLLYTEGFTIAGAKKKLEAEMRDGGVAVAASDTLAGPGPGALRVSDSARSAIGELRRELRAILDLLGE